MSGEQWGEAVPDEVSMAGHYAYGCGLGTSGTVAGIEAAMAVAYTAGLEAGVADTRRQIAARITDNVRNPDFAKQDRGGYHGFTECMAYVAGHDKAAAIALGSDTTDPSPPADDYPLVPSAADRWLDHGPREGGAS